MFERKQVTIFLRKLPRSPAGSQWTPQGPQGPPRNPPGPPRGPQGSLGWSLGAPWILRARFFGHQPALDIALLERGFHLAYCDVSDLYGSQIAIDRSFELHALTENSIVEQRRFQIESTEVDTRGTV